MAMVATEKEVVMVMRVESLYCALQASTERVASALQFHSFMETPESKFPILNFFKRMKLFYKEEKLYKLLSALTTLKSVFEVNMPFIVDGKLYFNFKDPSKKGSYIRQIGEAKSNYDLIAYFSDLTKRLSDTLALPEVSKAIASSDFAHYCPSLTRANLSFSDSCRKYLMESNAEEK